MQAMRAGMPTLPLWDWHDADGPDRALGGGSEAISPRLLALDEAMRADLALLTLNAPSKVARSF